MRLLVCGSRNWMDSYTLFDALDAYAEKYTPAIVGRIEIVHGAALGADSQASDWAMENQYVQHVFPARWDAFRKAAGPIRNEQMLDFLLEVPDYSRRVFAFSNDLENSRGTRDMVTRAMRAGVPVRAFTSDMEYEPQELREVMGL